MLPAVRDSFVQGLYFWFRVLKVIVQDDDILLKGPYPPCLRMADRALLAGYPPREVWHPVYHHIFQQSDSLYFLCVSGAFLIPYVIMMCLIGMPLLFMEYSFGQYFGVGGLTIFKKVCPMFQGKCLLDNLKPLARIWCWSKNGTTFSRFINRL